jgi:hypothetical protein
VRGVGDGVMKTAATVMATIAAVVLLVGAALAFMAPTHGPGMRHGMMMQMGSHMMTEARSS